MIVEPRVASVEVLVSMDDGSAHSITTRQGSRIESCTFDMERGYEPELWHGALAMRAPVVRLAITVDGSDIRFIQQLHPAPKEGP